MKTLIMSFLLTLAASFAFAADDSIVRVACQINGEPQFPITVSTRPIPQRFVMLNGAAEVVLSVWNHDDMGPATPELWLSAKVGNVDIEGESTLVGNTKARQLTVTANNQRTHVFCAFVE